MRRSLAARLARVRVLGRSPVNAYLRLNGLLWSCLPARVVTSTPARVYGGFLHGLVRLSAVRRQNFGTFFFRNRPLLELIRRLAEGRDSGSTLSAAFLACSNGSELYSVLWTIRSTRPDLNVIAHAVDISPDVLALAQKGVYSLHTPELVPARIFERMNAEEMQAMFDDRGDARVAIKSWLKEGITWHVGDAGSPGLVDVLGRHDMVVANNFLCHMEPPDAERCLRNVARLVKPGGYLFVSGIDLHVRTKVAGDLGWRPVRALMEDIHDGDPSMRDYWPWSYWSVEPLDKRRADWHVRYVSAFQLGAHPVNPPSARSGGLVTVARG